MFPENHPSTYEPLRMPPTLDPPLPSNRTETVNCEWKLLLRRAIPTTNPLVAVYLTTSQLVNTIKRRWLHHPRLSRGKWQSHFHWLPTKMSIHHHECSKSSCGFCPQSCTIHHTRKRVESSTPRLSGCSKYEFSYFAPLTKPQDLIPSMDRCIQLLLTTTKSSAVASSFFFLSAHNTIISGGKKLLQQTFLSRLQLLLPWCGRRVDVVVGRIESKRGWWNFLVWIHVSRMDFEKAQECWIFFQKA